MTNSVGDQTAVSRKDVLLKYLEHYESVCSEGNVKVCSDRQVTDEGRRVLMSELEPRRRFNTLDLYQTLSEFVQQRNCQKHIQHFIKAAELLEIICVNLFLFPWKKEIKTLKTFTGHFVYYIKPVLPYAKSILQSIGYCIETDTEYRLADSVDPEKAKNMGFDLFLARLECEYLLELMDQKSQPECLEILQMRATPQKRVAGEEISGHASDTCNLNEEVFQDDKPVKGGSLVNPGKEQKQESLKTHHPYNQGHSKIQDGSIPAVERPSSSFMSDDKSILEMQENYPDLAFRQKPIFRKSQKAAQPPKPKERKGYNAARSPELNVDMSGPQSIPMHAETTQSNRKLHIPNPAESQSSDDKRPVLRVLGCSCKNPRENCLAEQIGTFQMKELSVDEPLKYPIEETTQPCSVNNDAIVAPPTKSQDGKGMPILCNPSQEPVCNITGCGSCAGSDAIPRQDNIIKEPPQSIYIPSSPSPLSACNPPTDRNQENEGSSSQHRRSPTSQQPEDDLLQTYVMV